VQESATGSSLLLALGAQPAVVPAREPILEIPLGLAVTDEDEGVLVAGEPRVGGACLGNVPPERVYGGPAHARDHGALKKLRSERRAPLSFLFSGRRKLQKVPNNYIL
jgi:hypothetical protein